MAAIVFLVVINLRGVKESVTLLAPIFLTFVVTHILLIGYGVLSHVGQIGAVAHQIRTDYRTGLAALGGWGMLFLFLRAFSMGGGTFTGIEAVSNGLQILREPRVHNGKKTMVYMATSLAITAGGILVCYLLLGVQPVAGKTLNAVLAGKVFAGWGFGYTLALITIFSEGALLLVASQTGFVDGPRVMANMAVDYWFPHRFASLSDRFTIQNGVLLMGGAAVLLLIYSKGNITTLIVMYSINVFMTFSLSELGHVAVLHQEPQDRAALEEASARPSDGSDRLPDRPDDHDDREVPRRRLADPGHHLGRHRPVLPDAGPLQQGQGRRPGARRAAATIPTTGRPNTAPLDPKDMTAIQLVNGYNGFGVHTFLTIIRSFPGLYKNFIFVSVAEVDVGSFKGSDAVSCLEHSACDDLRKYVDLARRMGFPADFRYDLGTDIVETASRLVRERGQGIPALDGVRRPVRLPPDGHHPAPPAQRNGLRHPAGASLERDHDGHPAHPDQHLGPRRPPGPRPKAFDKTPPSG